jgi:hypothetical protein
LQVAQGWPEPWTPEGIGYVYAVNAAVKTGIVFSPVSVARTESRELSLSKRRRGKHCKEAQKITENIQKNRGFFGKREILTSEFFGV